MTLKADIAQRAPLRDKLARLTAEFEKKNGRVKTQPIRVSDNAYDWVGGAATKRVNMTAKEKAEQRRIEALPQVSALAGKGMFATEIAREMGVSSQFVRRVADENKIEIRKYGDKK